MSELRIGPQGREDELTRALRQMYAPPADPGYWDAFEARVMQTVISDESWWQPFAGWVRVGLVAAGVAFVVAAAGLRHAREVDARLAVQTIIETPRELSQQLALEATQLPPREATLRYVIEP